MGALLRLALPAEPERAPLRSGRAGRSCASSQSTCTSRRIRAGFVRVALRRLTPAQRGGIEIGAHAGAQLDQRVTQAALRGLESDAERARDLVERDAVLVVQQERGLLRQRQLFQALQQLGAGAAPEHELVDRILGPRPARPRLTVR